MAETVKTLLIGDSQLRDVKIDGIDVLYKSGLRTDTMQTLIKTANLAAYEQIVLWVGGNDAYPRYRPFDLTQIKTNFQKAISYIQGKSDAQVVIVSTTRREKDPHHRIRELNTVLVELARDNKASFCNAYPKFSKPTDLKDGIHQTTEAKTKFSHYIQRYLAQAPKEGVGRFAIRMEKRKANAEPILVRGAKSILSNFWTQTLKIGNTTYKSGERAHQHLKAVHLNEQALAHLILKARDNREAKSIGSVVNKRHPTIRAHLRLDWARQVIKARIAQQNVRVIFKNA